MFVLVPAGVSFPQKFQGRSGTGTRIFLPCFGEKLRLRKNPRAHKNKIGTPPPPPQPKIPPLKRGILWTWRFSGRNNTETLGVHKIGAVISGPRIADKNFTDTRIFLKGAAQ